MATVSRANLYRVPKKTWNKWSPEAREIFNYLYSLVRSNQRLFLHPQGITNSRTHWNTTAWNVAWEAAACRMSMEKAQADTKVRKQNLADTAAMPCPPYMRKHLS